MIDQDISDNIQSGTADAENKAAAKLECAMGGLNITLSIVLFVDGIILAIVAFCCLLMSFSLFFMAAIPLFLFIGFICILAFYAAAANLVAGIGAVISSKKHWKTLKISVATIIIDVVVIPANIIALLCGVYLLYTEVNFLSILIFIVAACAILLAIASIILSIIRMGKRKSCTVQ